MSFQTLLRSLVRGWYIPVLCAILGVAAAFALTRNATPSYTAESALLVSPASDAAAGTLISTMPTYAQLATMNTILEPVARELGVADGAEGLKDHVDASAPTGTALIAIDGKDVDPSRSARISSAVAQRLASYLSTSPSTKNQIRAEVVQPASVPKEPSSVPRSKILASGLILGLGLGLVLAMVIGALRSREVMPTGATRGRQVDTV